VVSYSFPSELTKKKRKSRDTILGQQSDLVEPILELEAEKGTFMAHL
jgi:hypothetical protein